MTIWVNAYVAHPEGMHADQGLQFTAAGWVALARSAGISLTHSGIDSCNSLGLGERYHSYLRNVYRRVRLDHQGIDQAAALSLEAAGMNQTTMPKGLVQTLLVFGVVPRLPVASMPSPPQRENSVAMATALWELQQHMATARLRPALSAPVPVAADRGVLAGQDVLVYRERPVDKWTGPFPFIAQRDNVV